MSVAASRFVLGGEKGEREVAKGSKQRSPHLLAQVQIKVFDITVLDENIAS